MTSKEKNIEKDIKEIMDYIKDLKGIVLKDLEILEILKKYLKVKSLELGIEDIIIYCENEKEFEKIKEWLENDK